MELMTVAAASMPPSIPTWAVAVFGIGALILALSHWRFRTGWTMNEQYGSRPKEREFVIMLGYIALPGAIVCASMLAMLLLGKFAYPTSNEWVGFTVMLLFVVAAGSGAWMAKEWFKPSPRRTPDWLRAEAGR